MVAARDFKKGMVITLDGAPWFLTKSGFVFMDSTTFDQVAVPEEIIGKGKWLLKECTKFLIRFLVE